MAECVNIPTALLQDKRLSLNDIRVYAALSQRADEGHKCSTTRNEIQRISGVQRISRHTQNLSRCGHICVDKAGDGNRNTYTLLEGLDEMKSPQKIMMEQFKKEFLEYSSGVHTKKTQKTYETAFREFIRVEGDRCLNTIGIREIEHFLSVKKGEASEWTSRKYYIALRAAFEKAVQWELIKENPFRKVKKPKPPEAIPAFFNEKEFDLFLTVIEDKDFQELCTMALLTGLRLGELLTLRWKDIDFTTKVILIQNSEGFTTKSKRSRVVPMSEDLCRLLRGRKQNIRCESEAVFHDEKGLPLKEGTASQKFKRYVRRAGLNDKLHFHSLRHSFASALVMSGTSLYKVQKLLGHSQSTTTEIYSHLLPQHLHNEVNILAARFKLQREQEN
ncbi:MAG: tyrosine-type recombinase/integrase [Candidatus Kryptoniota bacterium]